jgi:hypothetical protein
MSKGLADSGVEKWTVDTNAMTLTCVDKQARESDRGDLVVAVATSERLPPAAARADAANASR